MLVVVPGVLGEEPLAAQGLFKLGEQAVLGVFILLTSVMFYRRMMRAERAARAALESLDVPDGPEA